MNTPYRQAEAAGFSCENCGRPMPFALHCLACDTAYPERRRLDLFARLGLSRTFFLDPAVLDRKEVALARELHPDRFAGAGEARVALAERLQSLVNEALKVLADPFARAEHLLSLAPEWSDELKASKRLPGGFLEDQLRVREELAGGVTEGRAREIQRLARRGLKEVEANLATCFHRIEAGDRDPKALRHEARALLNQVRYLQNVLGVARGEVFPGAAP